MVLSYKWWRRGRKQVAFGCEIWSCWWNKSMYSWFVYKTGHNNFFYQKRRQKFVEGMKHVDSHFRCFDVYELNISKKQTAITNTITRAKAVWILCREMSYKSYSRNCWQPLFDIGLVDSLMRCSAVQLGKTIDEVRDIFKQFCADAGKRGTLNSDGKLRK